MGFTRKPVIAFALLFIAAFVGCRKPTAEALCRESNIRPEPTVFFAPANTFFFQTPTGVPVSEANSGLLALFRDDNDDDADTRWMGIRNRGHIGVSFGEPGFMNVSAIDGCSVSSRAISVPIATIQPPGQFTEVPTTPEGTAKADDFLPPREMAAAPEEPTILIGRGHRI